MLGLRSSGCVARVNTVLALDTKRSIVGLEEVLDRMMGLP